MKRRSEHVVHIYTIEVSYLVGTRTGDFSYNSMVLNKKLDIFSSKK